MHSGKQCNQQRRIVNTKPPERDRNGLLLLDAEYRTELPAAERRQRVERSDQTARSKRRPPAGVEEISIQQWRSSRRDGESMRPAAAAFECEIDVQQQNQTASVVFWQSGRNQHSTAETTEATKQHSPIHWCQLMLDAEWTEACVDALTSSVAKVCVPPMLDTTHSSLPDVNSY